MFGRRDFREDGWRGRDFREDERVETCLVGGMDGRMDGEEGSSILPGPPYSIPPNMEGFGGMDANACF